ncbi:hypothetical protein [Halosolutus halophilus]|uniref:hypothetical protein n=1 Tax=Halosolutus halophilus TaxID=1552990 RepID=UPI002234EDBF|nr:hypothetical protein [Halosolutus halophilus]
MVTLLAGLIGGAVATIVMTTGMMILGDDGPLPTAGLVAKIADGEPAAYKLPGMLLHMAFGVGAGAVFALGVPLIGLHFDSIAVAVGLGLVYGLSLMIGEMVFWMRTVLGMEPDRDAMVMFGAVHVVYGVVLGAVLSAGIFA